MIIGSVDKTAETQGAFVLMERVGYAKIKRCIEKTIWGRKYIIFLLFVV